MNDRFMGALQAKPHGDRGSPSDHPATPSDPAGAPSEVPTLGASDIEPTSATPPAGSLRLIGKVLSERYRIEGVIGEGGMGMVYLAEHLLMHKRLAVKILHAEMTRRPDVVVRFEREAMAAAHIEHPNVAAATDFGKLDDGSFFLVLEYVEGTNLFDVIGRGALEPVRALHIAHQIASALASAHALGIVHRDLKPENVMLVERGGDPDFVKVLDFGIAKVPLLTPLPADPSGASPGPITMAGMVYGTPEYMSPEQALGQEVDARADLYALGVILFELLTGVRPFEAEGKTTVLGMKIVCEPPSLISKNPNVQVTDAVADIVSGLLERDEDERFQTAYEVLDAIEASGLWAAKGRGASLRPPSPPPAAGIAEPYRALLSQVPRDARVPSPYVAALEARIAEQRARLARLWRRAKKAARKVRKAMPDVVGERIPFELFAGIGAGLLLVLIGALVFRASSAALVGDPPVTVNAAPPSVNVTVQRTPPTGSPRVTDPAAAERAVLEPASVSPSNLAPSADPPTAAPSLSARSKSSVRPKKAPVPITDFGGRK